MLRATGVEAPVISMKLEMSASAIFAMTRQRVCFWKGGRVRDRDRSRVVCLRLPPGTTGAATGATGVRGGLVGFATRGKVVLAQNQGALLASTAGRCFVIEVWNVVRAGSRGSDRVDREADFYSQS